MTFYRALIFIPNISHTLSDQKYTCMIQCNTIALKEIQCYLYGMFLVVLCGAVLDSITLKVFLIYMQNLIYMEESQQTTAFTSITEVSQR